MNNSYYCNILSRGYKTLCVPIYSNNVRYCFPCCTDQYTGHYNGNLKLFKLKVKKRNNINHSLRMLKARVRIKHV